MSLSCLRGSMAGKREPSQRRFANIIAKWGQRCKERLKAKFKTGAKDHSVGNHPLWEAFRMAYQMKHPPYIVGGLALGLGYAWSMIRRAEVPLSPELVNFVQTEQMYRLRKFFTSTPQVTAK